MKMENFDKRMKQQYGRLLQFNKKIIIITKVLFLFLNTTVIVAQNVNIHSNGNGYYFELAVANQAMSCIVKGCFDGLKRTKFIDENTDSDENRIKWRIDSINNYANSRPFFRTDFFYDAFLPPLVFYTTFYRTLDNSVFF